MHKLSNPNASREALNLYGFIQENFGKKIIAGTQECPGNRWHELEMEYIKRVTGHLPAIRGLDFIHNDYSGVVHRAKKWHSLGGIVTICWHTGVFGNSYPASKDENPDFEKLFTDGTDENNLLLQRWKRAAAALGELADSGVPVLYRPFHEFDGQWFWWGKGGAEIFKKLWRMMYETFTYEYKLNNLIWVLGYSGEVKPGWYPGDDFVDIIGSDNYDGTTNSRAWPRLKAVTQNKPYAFHEVGALPELGDFERDGALWSWFMTWHTKYLTEENSAERLKEYYLNPTVITLDDFTENI